MNIMERRYGPRRFVDRVQAKVIATLAVSLAVTVLTGCDLVVFDQEAAQGSREAAGMNLLSTIEIDSWDEYDHDLILQPLAFLPDTPRGSSGYLIALRDEGEGLEVVRVTRGRVTGREDYYLPRRPGVFRWSAHVASARAGTETSYPAPLILIRGGDDRGPEVDLVYPEDDEIIGEWLVSVELQLRELMRLAVIDGGFGLDPPDIAAVQIMTDLESTDSVTEFQILARDGDEDPPPPYREYFLRITGDALVEWDVLWGQDSMAPPPSVRTTGAAEIPRLFHDDDTPVRRYSYGNARLSATDPTERRGYLTWADGKYSGAPLRTLSWLTDVSGETPVEVAAWQQPIAAVDAGGTIRSSRSGRTVLIRPDGTAEGGSRSTVEYGTLWYAGQYVTAGGDLRDVYSAVGLAPTLDGWRLTIHVYED